MNPLERALAQVFATLDQVAVAVSGGVDSMTLAHLVHRHHGARARMVHATSPAVPAEATARVRAHADRCGWALTLIDAGEFADSRYRTNPIDRCYLCKSNLYARIAGIFAGVILSGTNTDDLGDYRVVDGIAFPFKFKHEMGGQKVEIDYDKVTVNPKLSPDLFNESAPPPRDDTSDA